MWSQTTWYIYSVPYIKHVELALCVDISCRLTPHVFIYGTVRRYIMSFDSTSFYIALWAMSFDSTCFIWHWVDISCRLTPHVFLWHWVDISCRLTPHAFIWHCEKIYHVVWLHMFYMALSRYIMSFDSTCFYMTLWVDIACRLTPHVFIWHWVDISCRLTPHVFIWHCE